MADMASLDEEKERQENQIRFETELEFIQCLANPFYLQSLAQRHLLTDPAFTAYLQYLSYWHGPRYARFIQYPHALHHLALLNDDSGVFKEALMGDMNLPQSLAGKQLAHWASWREDPVESVQNGHPLPTMEEAIKDETGAATSSKGVY